MKNQFHLRVSNFELKKISPKYMMDVVIVGNVEENSLIPPFLVQKDNLPVLFHIIKYWIKYASGKIYVLIPKIYIPICNGYLPYFTDLITENESSDSDEECSEEDNHSSSEPQKKILFEDIKSWIIPKIDCSMPLIYEDGNSIPFTMFFSKYLVANQQKENPSKKVFFTTSQYLFQENIDLFKTYKRTYKDIEKKIILFSKDIASSNNRGLSIDNIYNLLYTEQLENLNKKSYSNENFFFYTFRHPLHTITYPYINHIHWKVPINNIDIDCIFRDTRFFRKGKTPKGLSLIQKEVKFMNNWKKLDIPEQIQNLFLPVLQIYETAYVYSSSDKYVPFLHYLNVLCELDLESKNKIFEKIMQQLNQIHRLQKKTVETNHWIHDLKIIIQDKIQLLEKIVIQKSFNQVFSNLSVYSSNNNFIDLKNNLTKINGVHLQSLEEITEKCKNILTTYYTLLSNFRYVLIHGNLTFSNILINPKDPNDFVFTNPTSFFGKNDLFGLKEYDESKILLSLSGYDSLFHNHFKISIDESSKMNILLEITKPEFDKKITSQYFNAVHYAFVVLHWLHTPLNVENDIEKSIFAYYYGLYLGSVL